MREPRAGLMNESDFDDDEILSMGQGALVEALGNDDYPYSLFLQLDEHDKILAVWDILCRLGLRERSPESHNKFRTERREHLMIMHSCAVEGCTQTVSRQFLMCPGHWVTVPWPIKKLLYRNWNGGQILDGYWDARDAAIISIRERV